MIPQTKSTTNNKGKPMTTNLLLPKSTETQSVISDASLVQEKPLGGSLHSACSRLVLQRRYPPAAWHDHPTPHLIAWGPGKYATLEENIKAACEGYYALGQGCEFRMVRRTDETIWEYSANVQRTDRETKPTTQANDG